MANQDTKEATADTLEALAMQVRETAIPDTDFQYYWSIILYLYQGEDVERMKDLKRKILTS